MTPCITCGKPVTTGRSGSQHSHATRCLLCMTAELFSGWKYVKKGETIMKETIKATVAIKAESLGALQNALEAIAERAGMTIVADAAMSTSMSIESVDADDLREALTDIARAIDVSDGVEAKINAPAQVWQGRTALAGPTPMERMINRATGELFPK